MSPASYVEKFKTLMLVITGEKDYRVPYIRMILRNIHNILLFNCNFYIDFFIKIYIFNNNVKILNVSTLILRI